MGNCVSNTGAFEPPGSKAVASFVQQYDQEHDPRWIAIRAAEMRAARATEEAGDGAAGPSKPATTKKPKGPKCTVCFEVVTVGVNPWQRSKSDKFILNLPDSDDDDDAPESSAAADRRRAIKLQKLARHGLELASCKHVFCGACLSSSIFRRLNIAFDPSTYGTTVDTSETLAPTGPGKVDFPMGCPTCQLKPDQPLIEISDITARLVLGEPNMDPWNHARFLSTLNLIYCPWKGCNEAFDADDVLPAQSDGTSLLAKGLVQCPRCSRSLCKDCKVVWHDQYTCVAFQVLPITERNPEDLAFYELAKQEKWRRCPKCSAMVELKYGCNHITCTCKHHFCYQCGADFEFTKGKYRCKGGKGCKIWEEENLLEHRGG